ncbi:MAG: hypothetical protein QOE55_6419 [Acidobacteriaceae bacterium]|jgi:hypothetical protein|nr:hypothetical protein [Acidobacteriaceae bacterium]
MDGLTIEKSTTDNKHCEGKVSRWPTSFSLAGGKATMLSLCIIGSYTHEMPTLRVAYRAEFECLHALHDTFACGRSRHCLASLGGFLFRRGSNSSHG